MNFGKICLICIIFVKAFFYNRKMAPPPPPWRAVFLCDLELLPKNTNSGTRRRIEIFQKSKMIRIENPKLLAWFQTPQTVSRPSRPSRPSSHTNFGTRRRIEIFKKRKMIRIEFPKVLAWFQTPQTVSRLSRSNFQPRKDPNSSGWNPSCFLCGYTSNAACGKRLQGRSLFWTNQGLIMASSWI